MPFDAHLNLAYGLVTVAPSPASSGTTLTISDPSVVPTVPCNATVWAADEQPLQSNAEIVRVTNNAAGVLTIVRAQETDVGGPPARAIQVGDQISFTITVKTLTDVETAVDAKMASNRVSDFVAATAAFAGTSASGTIASNGISISIGPYLTTAAQSNAVVQSINGSTGTFSFNTGSSLSSSRNGNAFTFGLASDITTALQSTGAYLTTARASTDAIGLNTAQSNVTWTANSSGLSLDARGYAGTGTSATNASVTLNSNGLAISVAAPGAGANYSAGISTNGNTLGDTGLASNRLVLIGGNNITLSGSTNGGSMSLTISGPNAGGAQTGISGLVVSDATYSSGTVSFSNAGNITISSSVNGATQYIRLSGNAAQTAQTQSNIAGIYDGANSISTGTVRFTNANGVSFSINGQTLSGSVATTYLASNASTNYVQANAVFNGTNATGTIASNAISVSVAAPIPIGTNVKAVASIGSTGTITRYAPEDHQHAGVAAYAVTNTGNTLGNTRSQVGTLYIAASGAITASQSTAAAGNDTVWLSVAAQTNQSAIKAFGVSNTGQTAGNTGVSTGVDWVLAGSNSITLSQSTAGGGPNTVWIQHPAWLTTADLSANSSKYVQEWALTGNTAGTTSSAQGTRLYFSGGNNVTLSGSSNSIVFSVGNYLTTARASTDAIGLNTAQSNVTWTVNSSGLSLDARGYAGTVTSGHNATITVNSSGVTVSVAAPGAAAENNWFALTGNTSGNTTASGSTIALSGGNGVTLSGTNNSVIGISVSTYDTVDTATTVYSVASANSVGTVTRWAAEDHRHAGIGAIGISTGNTAGTTGSVLGTYWIAGGNNLTVSQITSNNGSHTLVLSVGNQAGATLSQYQNIDNYNGLVTGASAITQTSGSSIFVQPFMLPQAVSAGFVRLLASFNDSAVGTAGTTAANSTYSVARYTTVAMVVYSQGVGASSRSIQSVSSTSAGFTGVSIYGAAAQGSRYTMTLQKTYPVMGLAASNYTTSYAVSSGSIVISSESNTLFTGQRFLDISWAGSLSAGNYWLGIGASTSSASNSANISFAGTAGMPMSLAGVSQSNISVGLLGVATSASDHQIVPGLGVWTTNVSVISTGSIALSQVSQVVSNPQLPFQIIRQA